MRSFAPTIAILALLSAVSVTACGSETAGEAPRETVTATVGGLAFALDVTDALPEGVSADDITISQVPGADLEAAGSQSVIAALDLSPDGLVFDSPALLTFDVPRAGGSVEVHSVAADGEVDRLEPTALVLNPQHDTITMSVPVAHFSRIYVTRHSEALALLTPDGAPPDSLLVGSSFTVRIVADLTYADREETVPDALKNGVGVETEKRTYRYEPVRGAAWTLQYAAYVGLQDQRPMTLVANKEPVIQPLSAAESPLDPAAIPANGWERIAVPAGTTSSQFRLSFRCVREGGFNVALTVRAHWPNKVTVRNAQGVVSQKTYDVPEFEFLTFAGFCVDPTQTPTPTTIVDPGTPRPTATGITTGPADPTVVVPKAPANPSPYVVGEWHEAPLILAYAHDGAWYDGHNLSVVAAHAPNCTYEHLHGGPIEILVPVEGKPAKLTEMYGECGYGPSSALFWIEDPR